VPRMEKQSPPPLSFPKLCLRKGVLTCSPNCACTKGFLLVL
jgi:hypothetical protein